MGDLVAQTAESPLQEIVGDIGPEVPDMGIIINRRAAAIEPNFSSLNGFKDLYFPAKGIVQGKRHGTSANYLIEFR
jgi:hypothetical protein